MVAIEAPALAAPVRKTLLDVVNVITDAPSYALQNALSYEPLLTGGANRAVPGAGVQKVFDKRNIEDHTDTEVFTAYRGVDEPLLRGVGSGQAALEELFEVGESLYVEAKVQELLLSPFATDITPTPGTPVKDLDAALGLLEQWIATRYFYRPTLSGNLLVADLIQKGRPAAVTETVHGTPIASAAGFGPDGPGSAVAGPGAAWLYISGQINVWKGPANVQGGPDLKKNRDLSLVEKSYAVSIDGPVAAILVGF